MIPILIIKLLFYAFWVQLIIMISSGAKKLIKLQIRRKLRLGSSRANDRDRKQGLLSILNDGVRFTRKGDKRTIFKNGGPTRTITYWLIYIFGLLLTIASSFLSLILYPIALIVSLVSIIYAYYSSKSILLKRNEVKQRLYDSKSATMGLVSSNRNDVNFDSEFKILDWEEDNIRFNKVQFNIPSKFDQLNTDSVIEKMNQNFGGGTAWVPDSSNNAGWDFANATVTFVRTAELPHKANWDAHYVLNDNIAWSFFPLGLGVDNGVSIVNPETGETEHVLGFDLQRAETKLSKKKGFAIGKEIQAAPQVLIAGGTGGGKALAEDTIVQKIVEENEEK